jgi:tetratricopeptide (TPR) repeat protein
VTLLEHTIKRLKGLVIKRPGMTLGLWGEAGIGKTHTTQQVLHQVQCEHLSQHATSPLSSIARALPKPKKLPVWAQTILEKLERNEYLSIEQSISAFAVVLSENAPFILHLEDVHEASAEQLEWIVALANAVTRLKGVALLVTSRNTPPAPFEAIRLEVLGFEATKVLLEQEARAALPPEAIEWIHGRAAGNPLFTVEFFKFLARLGFVWNDGQQWRWHTPQQDMMPATVEALIEQMLNQAIPSQVFGDVLAVKTMLPRDTDLNLWASIVGISRVTLNETISELSKRGILIHHEFAHPLFGEVSAQKISLEQRQNFARKALHALEDKPFLAVSFVQDAALSKLKSQQWIERAIAQAVNTNNLAMACDLKIQALEWYEPDAQQQLGLQVAKEVRFYNLPKAASLFERFAAQSSDDIYVHAEVLARLGRLTDAKQLLENMPQTLQNELTWLEHLVMVHNDAEDHVGVVTKWDEQAHLHSSKNPKFLYKVAQSLIVLSRFKDAVTILEFALQQKPSEALQADIFLSKGILSDFVGDTKSAEIHYRTAERFYQQTGDSYGLGCVFYRLGTLEYYQDSLSKAVGYLEQSIKFFTEVGHQAQRLQSLTLLAATRTELNQCQTAERELLEAEEQLRGTTFTSKWIMTCTNLSFLYRGWDVPYGAVLALKYARAALQGATEIKNPRLIANCLYHAAKSETCSNNPSEGLRLADQCLALAEQLEYPAMLAYSHHARYQALLSLNRFDEALAALQTAEVKNRILGHNHDANFYALEYQCLTKNWDSAREMLMAMRSNESFFFAQIATRNFPELEQTSTTKPIPELRLTTLGGIRISNTPIRGRKRQELLILLLEARITGKPQLEKLELLEALYPQDPEDRAASSLKELIRGTRTSLGKEIIQTTVGGYALGQMTSDIEEFLKNGDTQLWQGMYLQNLEFENSQSVRDLLEQALHNRMLQLLETDVREASRVSRFLLTMNPYDLEILRLSLYALRAARNYKTLERVYENAKGYLLEVGETLPENWQDFLTQSLKAAYPPQNLTTI